VLATQRASGQVAPRARVERATYCLGGTPAPALRTPAKTHVTRERNRYKQSLPKTISWRASSRVLPRGGRPTPWRPSG
jgi:hypothetical protein